MQRTFFAFLVEHVEQGGLKISIINLGLSDFLLRAKQNLTLVEKEAMSFDSFSL